MVVFDSQLIESSRKEIREKLYDLFLLIYTNLRDKQIPLLSNSV